MPDNLLLQHLINLADAIREIPPSREHEVIVDRFRQVVTRLEAVDAIQRGSFWNLSSNRT